MEYYTAIRKWVREEVKGTVNPSRPYECLGCDVPLWGATVMAANPASARHILSAMGEECEELVCDKTVGTFVDELDLLGWAIDADPNYFLEPIFFIDDPN